MFDYIIMPYRRHSNPDEPPAGAHAGMEENMVLIVAMMILLCLAETLSDVFLACVRRLRNPRAQVIVRARQYRFN